MKNLLLTLLLVISVNMFSQNISGKITYIVSMEPFNERKLDSAYQVRTKKKMDKWMKDIFKNTPDVKVFLEFDNGKSLYYVEDKMQNDGKSKLNLNRTFAGGDNKYYRNANTKEQFHESTTFGEPLLIELQVKKWKITQESKKIGNYLCFKAIDIESKNRKMKPVVWFTPQIPFSFGPKEFNGLPGLVILVEMSKRTISASNITLNPKKEIVIKKPTKGKKITAEESSKRGAAFWKSIEKQ